MFRFLHSGDLHLGKPFGRFPDDVRIRLRLAREGIVARLAQAARAGGATHVLLAGDTFDAETPDPRLVRQAMNAIEAAGDLIWVILPGNHDSLTATELWSTLARGAPPNLVLALTPAPILLPGLLPGVLPGPLPGPLAGPLPGVVILPAPCPTRRPGQDVTEALGQATPEGLTRIGLAHGAITDFAGGASEDGNPAIIPPDRAERAGLAYLALGDWHGQMAVGGRTWYAGTPERDSFRHQGPGLALLVTCPGPNAVPQARPVPVGALDWLALTLDLLPEEDAVARLMPLLPGRAVRAAAVLGLTLQGRMHLSAAQGLRAAIGGIAPDFLHLELQDGVVAEVAADDLDLIDRAGALRETAERLVAEAADTATTPAARKVAGAALSRLFAFAGDSG